MILIKVIEQQENSYKSHLLDISDIRAVSCTYPRIKNEGVQQEVSEETVAGHSGQKIEFEFKDGRSETFDLSKTPTKFIVYDDYGNQLIENSTDDLFEVEETLRLALAKEYEDEQLLPGV